MKNMIYEIDNHESQIIRSELKKDESIHLVVIDGREIQSWIPFLEKMISEFELPMLDNDRNINGYFDWMRDLDWLGKAGYVLFIENYNEFMKEDLKMAKKIIDDFKNCILPFWDSEVERVVVEGKAKRFDVYLVK